MLMTAPPPALRSSGKAAREAANVPSVSISITVRKPLALSSSAAAWPRGARQERKKARLAGRRGGSAERARGRSGGRANRLPLGCPVS